MLSGVRGRGLAALSYSIAMNADQLGGESRANTKTRGGNSQEIEVLSYCLLLEEKGQKVEYGLIALKGTQTAQKIFYTDAEREKIVALINEIRDFDQEYTATCPPYRYNGSAANCQNCFRSSPCKIMG
jgi:CRISPR/Cas system-associated exonuclease Cas4 (RecB family)